MAEKGLDKQLKEIVEQINTEYDQSSMDIDLRHTNLPVINERIEIIIQTSFTIMNQLNVTRVDSPIYFDREKDELIKCKTYFTQSFYDIDE